ncbi:hypothetical protein GCM10009864_79440 [Streptomyces lunalinharesii]|uniref:Transposase n=1 Tax=Streptomyces lunalinharesii TaxID=333384 RepID=A0ABP6FJQ5_9ACTN
MNAEFSASVCCSWEAVRMAVEKDGVGLDASKADLRGPASADRGVAGTGRRMHATVRLGLPNYAGRALVNLFPTTCR